MKILISGATGLVGAALTQHLKSAGHDARALARTHRSPVPHAIGWNVETGELDRAALASWGGPDAVVHLAGENIAGKRWSTPQKNRLRSSRVDATERLAKSLAELSPLPRAFISASGVGYYGDRAEEILTEQSPRGTGFLPDMAAAWERAADALAEKGARVTHLRFGMILSRDGGALGKMLPAFKWGVGGKLGSGKQWISWVTLRDVLRIIEWVLEPGQISGPVNVVAPNPVRNSEFTKALGRALGRPAILPVPAIALRLVLGEMVDSLLLSSQRAVPKRLAAENFQFEHTEIQNALNAVLNDGYKT